MTTVTTVFDLGGVVCRLRAYQRVDKKQSVYITLIAEASGDDGIYYPAQSLSIAPNHVKTLRDALNELGELE